jgi:glycosyltransferase involved in cell wall biosynthesis
MGERARYAIVTPYHKEERWLLERCIQSVRKQTMPADHIVVADGFPQNWIDAEGVRHIRLDRNHADYGNTPRAIGALLAVSAGYEGIGFLDADNWLEPNHVASCVEASERNDACDFVIARRNLCRPDGSVININDPPVQSFVDTSCFFLLPGSYHVIPHFSLIPRELSPICDRVFYTALKAKKLNAEVVAEKTVNYHCLWSFIYEVAGETPPPGAKDGIDYNGIRRWVDAQDERGQLLLARRTGCRISIPDGAVGSKMSTDQGPLQKAARRPGQ